MRISVDEGAGVQCTALSYTEKVKESYPPKPGGTARLMLTG